MLWASVVVGPLPPPEDHLTGVTQLIKPLHEAGAFLFQAQ